MKNDKEILNELRQLSPLVADLNRKDLLKVPENYFEQLAGVIMLRIKAMQADGTLSSSLDSIDKSAVLTAPPAGYFEGFAEKMLNRIKGGEANAVDQELARLSPVLSRMKRETPFSVPQNYLEEFSETVVQSAKAIDFVNDEMENLSPLMKALKDKHAYRVPYGYFESFSGVVLSRLESGPRKSKIIGIGSRKTWLSVAAAAIVIGIISTIGLYTFNRNAQPPMTDPIAALSKLSDDEVNSYLQDQYSPIYDSLITNTNNPLATIDLSNNDDPAEMLNNISDDELKQYINEDISFKDEQVN